VLFRSYPVPFTDQIRIDNIEGVEKITLTSLPGQTYGVWNTGRASSFTIPASDIGSGTYLLNLHLHSGEVVVRRIVKYREPELGLYDSFLSGNPQKFFTRPEAVCYKL